MFRTETHLPEDPSTMPAELRNAAAELVTRARQNGQSDIESAVELQQLLAGRPQFEANLADQLIMDVRRAGKTSTDRPVFLRESRGTLDLVREAGMKPTEIARYESWLISEIRHTTEVEGMAPFLDAVEQIGISKEKILTWAIGLLVSRSPWNINKFGPGDVQLIADKTNTPLEQVQRQLAQAIAAGPVNDGFWGVGTLREDKSNSLKWMMRLTTTYGVPEAIVRPHFTRIVDEVVQRLPVFLKNRVSQGQQANKLIEDARAGYDAIVVTYPQYADLAQRVLAVLTIAPESSPASATT